MLPLTDQLRLVVAGAGLLVAAVYDWTTMRVPNLVWLPMLLAALVVDLVEPARIVSAWPYLLAAGGVVALAFGIWRVGIWGGADAKAIMVLALLVPYPVGPDRISSGLHLAWAPPVVTIFLVGALLGLPMALAALRVRGQLNERFPYLVPICGGFVLVVLSAIT
jgi:hypothetical protein